MWEGNFYYVNWNVRISWLVGCEHLPVLISILGEEVKNNDSCVLFWAIQIKFDSFVVSEVRDQKSQVTNEKRRRRCGDIWWTERELQLAQAWRGRCSNIVK